MEKKSTHEIKITYNHYKTEPPRSTFMIERIITSDDTEIYKDIQSVDMHAKEQASIFSQFENWLNDYVSLEQCQHEQAVVLEDDRNVGFTEITLLKMLRKKFPSTFCRLSPDNIRWECKKGVSIELRFQRCMTFDELKTLEEMLGLGFCISFNFNQGLGSCK